MKSIAIAILLSACPAIADNPATSEMEKPDSKVSCSLTPAQLQKQRQELIPGLLKRADKVSDLTDGDGLRLHFKHRAGLLSELAQIVEREQDCCNFLSFNIAVEAAAAGVTFDISGPTGTRKMLKSL